MWKRSPVLALQTSLRGRTEACRARRLSPAVRPADRFSRTDCVFPHFISLTENSTLRIYAWFHPCVPPLFQFWFFSLMMESNLAPLFWLHNHHSLLKYDCFLTHWLIDWLDTLYYSSHAWYMHACIMLSGERTSCWALTRTLAWSVFHWSCSFWSPVHGVDAFSVL